MTRTPIAYDLSSASTMEGAILRALTMTGAGAPTTAESPPRILRFRGDVGLVASDIFRFRPKGAVGRHIKVEYIVDPARTEAVLLRLTPASAADLPAPIAQDDLMSSQHAADLLNVSRPYVTNLVDGGAFKGVVCTAAGHRRIPRAEVERVRAEMRGTRREAPDAMEEITTDRRTRELERARATANRRWGPTSA